MSRDPVKAKARKQRYLDKQKAAKYGPEAIGKDMRGKHGNQAKGERNGRWNKSKRRVTSHGYVAVRVPVDHPHAWGPVNLKRFKYAYEHVVVMMEYLGRPLYPTEVVHHRNGNRADNRIENLESITPEEHQRHHADTTRERDSLGRFI